MNTWLSNRLKACDIDSRWSSIFSGSDIVTGSHRVIGPDKVTGPHIVIGLGKVTDPHMHWSSRCD